MSRLGRTLGSTIAILAMTATAAAQLPPGPPTLAPGTGIIVGQVLDAATGRGVASAVVTLAGSRRVMTTTSGQFAFRSLPEGSHSLTAAKSGYLDGAHGMRRPGGPTLPVVLEDGERRGNLVIWLWKHGAITGTVVDEAGEPLVGIQVTAVRRSILGGRRRFVPAGTGTTDDRGMYRIGRLTPGDYAVGMATSQVSVPAATVRQYEESVMSGPDPSRNAMLQAMFQIGGMPTMTGSMEARQLGDQVQSIGRGAPTPPPAEGSRLFAYPSVFYPAAPSAPSAAVVSVSSGQERTGIDLQARPVPMVKVSGTVVGGSGSAANLPLRLLLRGSEDFGRTSDVAGTLTDANGGFTFLGVPSGDYLLKIVQTPRPVAPSAPPMTIAVGSGMTISGSFNPNPEVPPVPAEPTMWATMPLAIGDADVSGVNIVLRTGARVSGRVEFEGAADKPAADQLSRIMVLFEPVDGQMDRISTPPSRIDAKGQFTSYGLAGGHYYIRVPSAPTGWTFRGAFLGERDVSDISLELDTTDVADVVLRFTDRPSSLSGTVQLTERAAREGVAVIVFPADSKAWMETNANPRRMRKVAVDDTGSYTVSPLPAGAYYVAAVSDSVAGDWQDPAFLEQLVTGAAHVQIDDGEKATQSLRIQEIR
jgi:Carboxypeptidase regulatory-like domain